MKGDSLVAKKETVPKSTRRSHRAQFPTPGFYLFSFLLNLASLPIVAVFIYGHQANITLWTLAGLSALGVAISIYAVTLRPMESNKKARKILISAVAAYGFILLAVQGFNIIINPNIIIG